MFHDLKCIRADKPLSAVFVRKIDKLRQNTQSPWVPEYASMGNMFAIPRGARNPF